MAGQELAGVRRAQTWAHVYARPKSTHGVNHALLCTPTFCYVLNALPPKVLVTNKLTTADAAKQLVDGGVQRIYKVDSHIGERRFDM